MSFVISFLHYEFMTFAVFDVSHVACHHQISKLDYIHSSAHGCITQPPCVAPSGDCERVIS